MVMVEYYLAMPAQQSRTQYIRHEAVCRNCSQLFVTWLDHNVSPKRAQKGAYCSRECVNKWQRKQAQETFRSHLRVDGECFVWTGGVVNTYGRVTYLGK